MTRDYITPATNFNDEDAFHKPQDSKYYPHFKVSSEDLYILKYFLGLWIHTYYYHFFISFVGCDWSNRWNTY